uniref:Uncharacterized protein n=1 Tax=Brassica oleracea TaxID=3712 RepID=A0A3P6FJT3_BRAOL|nr:unnamed protein product [Brassica oleracea]
MMKRNLQERERVEKLFPSKTSPKHRPKCHMISSPHIQCIIHHILSETTLLFLTRSKPFWIFFLFIKQCC